MRTVRIFQAQPPNIGQKLALSPEASLHVGGVLRMQAGEFITLFCGNNCEYNVLIEQVTKKQVVVLVKSEEEVNRESPRALHLAQGISKGERMEWVIQKAVELGVTSITPIITSRCVVRLTEDRFIKKHKQWQSIAISACEQSGRNLIPSINPITKIDNFLADCNAAMKFILSPMAQKTWREIQVIPGDISVLIGPEGGLTPEEVQQAQASDFTSLALGPRILRTETAAVVALSILQAIAGDL